MDFQCSCCNKILKNPIHLPCFCDTICAEHLKDSNVLKEKCIKCHRCNEAFPLNESDFKTYEIVQNLLAKEIYLGDVGKKVKKPFRKGIESLLRSYGTTKAGRKCGPNGKS